MTRKATKVIIIYSYYKENLQKLTMCGENDSNNNIAQKITSLIVVKARDGMLKTNTYLLKFDGNKYHELMEFERKEYFAIIRGNKK